MHAWGARIAKNHGMSSYWQSMLFEATEDPSGNCSTDFSTLTASLVWTSMIGPGRKLAAAGMWRRVPSLDCCAQAAALRDAGMRLMGQMCRSPQLSCTQTALRCSFHRVSHPTISPAALLVFTCLLQLCKRIEGLVLKREDLQPARHTVKQRLRNSERKLQKFHAQIAEPAPMHVVKHGVQGSRFHC